MNSLSFILVLLGVFLPSSFGSEKDCKEKGDGRVDWTTKDQVWYHCQTSQANRKINNCYVAMTDSGEGEADAVVHSYNLKTKESATFTLQVKRISDGKYEYPESKSKGVNIKVSRDGKCLTYWKCHDDAGHSNGVAGSGAYFMFMCNDPNLCKPQDKYEGDYKTIFEEAKREKKLTKIFDFDQNECKKLKIQP